MASDVPKDRLEVRVLEAKNLRPVDGGSVNPYVVVQCGQDDDQMNTDVKTGSSNPEWKNSPIMVFDSITAREIEFLFVKVKHKDLLSYQDKDLGVVPLSLSTALQSPGIALDEWYSLQKSKEMTNNAEGSVRLVITYFLDQSEDLGLDQDVDEDDDHASTGPNAVKVIVEGARNLLPPGGLSTCDPFVVLQCNNKKKESKQVRRNLFPKFGFEQVFYNTEANNPLIVTVKHKTTIGSTFIGQATISMVEIAGSGEFQKWVQLVDETGGFGARSRGEVQVKASWTYDPKVKKPRQLGWTRESALRKQEKRLQDELDKFEREDQELLSKNIYNQQDSDDEMGEDERKQFLDEQEDRERKAKVEIMELEERRSRIKPGDYQMQVHVIEARDLKAEDLQGTSDPVVFVYCMGKKKKTRIIKSCTSCVFDEVLYFNFKEVTLEQMTDAVVKVVCYDANNILPNEIIGSYQFDFMGVYLNSDHEVYRKWIGIADNENKSDTGIQGYLKVTITILGPGDRQKVHDLNQEIQDELKEEARSGALGGMAVAGPNIKQDLNFLVVSLFRAEDLPDYSIVGKPSIRAFVRLDFAGNPTNRTRSVYGASRESIVVEFKRELHMPVYVPTMGNRITLTLWSWEITGHKLVGTIFYDFEKVQAAEKKKGLFRRVLNEYVGEPPKWGNLYGAPENTSQSKESAKLMNRFPQLASHYRGRILVGMYRDKNPPSKRGNNIDNVAIKYELPPELYPPTAKYVLRAYILQGSEIPTFLFPNMQGAAPMKIVVSIGSMKMETKFQPNRQGMVEWVELKELKLELPQDVPQMPDIFVYLVKGPEISNKEVSFIRIKPITLLEQKFKGEPTWYTFEADPTRFGRFGLSEDTYPGSVLLQLGFGWKEHSKSVKWQNYEDMLQQKAYFLLRLHIFQCKNLPSGDENGLLDPFVKARFMGHRTKTPTLKGTCSPCFYKTLEFEEHLTIFPMLMPDLIVQVWDRDRFGRDTQVANLHVPCTTMVLKRSTGTRFPNPGWRRLLDVNGKEGDPDMQILISTELVQKKNMNENFPKTGELSPKPRWCYMDIIYLGVRDLEPLGFTPLGASFLEFSISSIEDGEKRVRTKTSKLPNAKNPNFGGREIMALKLPENYLYIPQLTVRVFNGPTRKLLGVGTIDISTKVPWNDENYQAPQMHAYKMINDNVDEGQQQEEGEDEEDEGEEGEDKEGDDDDKGKKKKKKKKDGEDGEKKEGEEEKDKDGEGKEGEGKAAEEEKGKDPAPAGTPGPGASKDPEVDTDSEEDDEKGEALDVGIGIFPMKEEERKLADLDLGVEAQLRKVEAVLSPEEERKKKAKKGWWQAVENAFDPFSEEDEEVKLEDLDIAFPMAWSTSDFLVGRDWWTKTIGGGQELERHLQYAPFENYKLYRGSSRGEKGFFFDSVPTKRQIGVFKGLIIITETQPDRKRSPYISLPDLKAPKPYVARLYIIQGMHLQPKDLNGKSDPYITIKIGKSKFKRKTETLKKKTLEPEFYHFEEIPVTIPGDSQLKIQVFDWDRFGADELIGETVIDLEDRWFSLKWQDIGSSKWLIDNEKIIEDSEEFTERRNTYGDLKPIEHRDLMVASSTNPQGQLKMWLEIVPSSIARNLEPEKISPPPPMVCEVRVVIWKAKDVVSLEAFTGLSDLLVKCWMTGNPKLKKTTDIHWRAKEGKASWNWRIKFDIELPLRGGEGGRLMIQLWEKNIGMWDEAMGETSVELYQWLQMVYTRKDSVKPFKELNEAKVRYKEMKKQEALGMAPAPAPIEPEKKKKKKKGGVEGLSDEELAMLEEAEEEAEGDGEEDGLLDGEEEDDEESEEEKDDDDKPKQGFDDTKELINKIKEFLGIGPIAEDAEWIKMSKFNWKKKKLKPMGEIAVSIELIPKDLADSSPVGEGRREPNQNPYLPPPVGRFQFSFNPFKLGMELLGARACFQIMGCGLCALAIVVFAVAGQYYQTITLMISQLKEAFSWKHYADQIPSAPSMPSAPSIPSMPTTPTLPG